MKSIENIKENKVFEFAEFSFDLKEKILRRDSETISMPPKTCDLLAVLLRNHGELLTKDELFKQVWADVFVEEANLSHHIAVLRKTLGENNNGRKFIETVPRRGYCFVATVRENFAAESVELIISERTQTRTIVSTEVETSNESKRLTEKAAVERSRRNNQFIFPALILLLAAAAAAILLIWRWTNPPKTDIFSHQPSDLKIKRLMPDDNTYAVSIAPDGASVVFMQSDSNSETMWRKQIASGEMTQLLPTDKSGEFGIIATRFSPDGKWIYYKHAVSDFAQSEVYRIGASGGGPQKIISKVEGDFSISPDGKQLAFVRDCRQLIIADVETAVERVVVERNGESQIIRCTLLSSAAWSPDGKRLAFAASNIEDNQYVHQLREVNLETGVESQIPLAKDFGPIYQIEWLPDGQGLLVTHDKDFALPDQIWYIAYPSGDARRISNETDDYDRTIRLSADGKKLATRQALGHINLWIAPLDDFNRRKQITLGAAAKHGNAGLAFMPDGEIVYSSLESGAVDLWTIDQNGENKRQLTVNAGYRNINPRVTRDGRFLVFTSTRTGIDQVWRTDIDGRNPVQLTSGLDHWLMGLSPENEVYYSGYSAEKKRMLFYKIPVEGGGGEPVLVDDRIYSSPVDFSPDGKWISFYGSEKEGEKPRNGLIDRATGKTVRYFDKIVGSGILPWSPDSKSIIYADTFGKGLWRQPIDGGNPTKLADLSPNGIYFYDISPDGKNIVLALGSTNAEIVLTENLFETIK